MDIDLAELASLVTLLKEADFTEFRYDKGDTHIVVRRGVVGRDDIEIPPALPSAPATPATTASPAAKAAVAPTHGAKVVTAPMLGTFYVSPKPGEPPFVKLGDTVGPESVVCIIEVMKLMNSVNAEWSGTIVGIHAENGALVEFGQPLFSIQEAN
ncbi:acetyl-CoA carboxylase biotin carboxyl carrier protein [Pusillimonas sp. NJUB218]|uniref:acetyl-CoA carboxylase biotin carboxyl carrier protein n=1 Tax=Pusillimonas sp. NJUB218 TaxID=2023230 RepID=UPI000F4BE38A|nr:acetyl-CoA carboxylase biotin carboxyl carrier protein [Pusillimonas sp. NJUB218]ROT45787.1 acetyl-CoA carboxylase, biotin carboxyl carrier protein [Pusillimonas sp. NJUB218]